MAYAGGRLMRRAERCRKEFFRRTTKLGSSAPACNASRMNSQPTSAGSQTVSVERRRNRSSDALIALSHLLESARRRERLPALAIADASGLLVAGAGIFQDCEELAAQAPLLVSPATAEEGVTRRLDAFQRHSQVRRVFVNDVEVLVCGQGDGAGCDRALPDVVAGCQRILGTRRPFL